MIEANRKAKIMLKARSLKQTLHRKRPFNTSRMCCVAVNVVCLEGAWKQNGHLFRLGYQVM